MELTENTAGPTRLWHAMKVPEVLRHWKTDPGRGLEAAEVQQRLSEYGPNALEEPSPKSHLQRFAAQFADFMIVVLIVAALIGDFIGEPADAVAIGAIVLLNAIVGFVQEVRAERAMALLKKLAGTQAISAPSRAANWFPATLSCWMRGRRSRRTCG